MARQIDEWDILGWIVKIAIAVGVYSIFVSKSAQARKKLRSQFLLGSFYERIEKKIAKEIADKEDFVFRQCWRSFGGLSTGWATTVSAILLWIIASFLIQIIAGFVGGIPFLGSLLVGILNIAQWIVPVYVILVYRKKFNYYHSFLPSDTASLMANASQFGLGTENGQPTQEFVQSVDINSELILGQSTKIPLSERKTHMYVIGRIGSGKSKAAEYWFTQDALLGRGVALVDPHGDLVDNVLLSIAAHLYQSGASLESLESNPLVQRIKIIDPTDKEYAIGYNPLQSQEGIDTYMQAKQLEDTFKKVWKFEENEAPVMSEVLRNMSYALIKNNLTLLEATALLTNEKVLHELIKKVDNVEMKMFWQDRYQRWLDDLRNTKNESSLNKISTFAADTYIRPMLGQVQSAIRFRESMDKSDILIFKLAKGKLGSGANLLGAFFIASMHLAAISREDIPTHQRVPFYVYVDEFQNFTSANFEEILREDRKYGLHYTLINQDLGSIDEETKHAIFGNVNATVSFQLGSDEDAELIATKFFRLTGTMIKTVGHSAQNIPGLPIPTVQENIEYHSVDAESKLRAQEFRLLPPRVFAVNYNGLPKPLVDVTINLSHQGIPEDTLYSYVTKIKEISNKRNGRLKTEVTKEINERLETLLNSAPKEPKDL